MVMQLICVARHGLCNRLRTLLGAKTLAEETQRELLVYWERSTACGCEWADLFQEAIPILKQPPAVEFEIIGFGKNREMMERHLKAAAKSTNKTAVVFSACSLGNPVHHFRHFDSLFRPIEVIQERVASLRRRFLGTVLGVHVRLGDFRAKAEAHRQRTAVGASAAFEEYFKTLNIVRQTIGSDQIYLASDDGSSVSHRDPVAARYYGAAESFKQAFGADKILQQPKPNLDRSQSQSIQDALVDLLVLRSCSMICGQAGSSFSRMAAIGKRSIMLDFEPVPM